MTRVKSKKNKKEDNNDGDGMILDDNETMLMKDSKI